MANLKKFHERTKIKLLQKMGTAERRSADEFVEECSAFVTTTFNSSCSLKKEIRKFVEARKVMQQATQNIHHILLELYDEKWAGKSRFEDKVKLIAQSEDRCTQVIAEKSLLRLEEYITDFATIKEQVKQRKRKASYFDSAQRNLHQVENEKKKDEAKINKAKVELEDTKRVYEICNHQMRDKLPQYYDERLDVFSECWTSIFTTLHTASAECSQYYQQIVAALKEFREEVERGQYKLSSAPSSMNDSFMEDYDCTYEQNEASGIDLTKSKPTSLPRVPENSASSTSALRAALQNCEYAGCSDEEEDDGMAAQFPMCRQSAVAVAAAPEPEARSSKDSAVEDEEESCEYALPSKNGVKKPAIKKKPRRSSNSSSTSSSSSSKPPLPAARASLRSDSPASEAMANLYYEVDEAKPQEHRVRVKYPYVGKDGDELTVEPGDIILVQNWDDKDDKEEGWLRGTREADGSTGIVPENYCVPLEK